MKKLFLYVFLGLMFCNTVQALPECEGEDDTQWTNCFGTYENIDVSLPGDEDKRTRDFTGAFGSVPGKRHGEGSSKVYKDGSLFVTYVGEFKDDKAHGQGIFTFVNGDEYVGEFKDGELHGQGTYYLSNGDEYVGEFKDGKAHSQGTWTYEDGRVEKGILKKDKLIKFATVKNMMPINKGFDFICYNSCKERNDESFCRQKCSMQ